MIGVLAFQGGFKEHCEILNSLGLDFREVRSLRDMESLNGLIIPGGESTVISTFLRKYEMENAIKEFDKPIFGTCAGLIILAHLGVLDVQVERNAYGRQLNSFTNEHGHFIRAPKITNIGPSVKPLLELNGDIILVRQGLAWGASFHPELIGNTRFHEEIFCDSLS